MGRRSRKSKRKLNSMFMALLLTAILLIMSTYAWFTANRVVTINGIHAKVTVAEGLQISLDGQNWSNTITADAKTLAALGTAQKTGQTDIPVNSWIWPSELKPVSTDGTMPDGVPIFKDGSISTDGLTLTGINQVTPNYSATVSGTGADTAKGEKIIAFDVYLRNTSGQTASDTDKFQLGIGSSVAVLSSDDGGVEGTGLENSSRVGILLYGGQVSTSAQNQYDICNIAVGSSKFAIWEPNYAVHISDTVAMDSRLTSDTQQYQTFAIKRDSESDPITDVTNNSDTANLKAVKTTFTPGGSVSGKDVDLLDVNQTSDTSLTLPRNAVSKAKIFIWLEGQDPDCNDYASAGGGLQYVLKFTKPGPQQGNGGTGGTGG